VVKKRQLANLGDCPLYGQSRRRGLSPELRPVRSSIPDGGQEEWENSSCRVCSAGQRANRYSSHSAIINIAPASCFIPDNGREEWVAGIRANTASHSAIYNNSSHLPIPDSGWEEWENSSCRVCSAGQRANRYSSHSAIIQRFINKRLLEDV